MTERLGFADRLTEQMRAKNSLVCVGIDPQLDRIPESITRAHPTNSIYAILTRFADSIVTAVEELAPAIKPNRAFWEQHGKEGTDALRDFVNRTHEHFPNLLIVGDTKDTDIARTNEGHAKKSFADYGYDAVTANPYFGDDTYPPFLAYPGKGLLVLCKTSNPKAHLFQDAPVSLEYYQRAQQTLKTPLTEKAYDLLTGALVERITTEKTKDGWSTVPLYWIVAARTGTLAQQYPDVGMVVGATHPEAFIPVRKLFGPGIILVPGLGTQQGDLEKTLRFGLNEKKEGLLLNSASGIIHASSKDDFAEVARKKAQELRDQSNKFRETT